MEFADIPIRSSTRSGLQVRVPQLVSTRSFSMATCCLSTLKLRRAAAHALLRQKPRFPHQKRSTQIFARAAGVRARTAAATAHGQWRWEEKCDVGAVPETELRHLGRFEMAYLEPLVRIADWKARARPSRSVSPNDVQPRKQNPNRQCIAPHRSERCVFTPTCHRRAP